jgi:putative transposase
MPRKAREKYPEAIFHIMCRSIPEVLLLRDDDDKNYYLGLLKRYTDQYNCAVYGFCFMDNHLHFHFDPKGFDVSKFMHSTNTAYVRYYNVKYKRYGRLFQDRFESRVLDTDEYNLTVSAYIHNNPKDIEGFSGKEEKYEYSSYGVYLGQRADIHKLVDKSYIMGLFGVNKEEDFRSRYFTFVSHQRDIGSFKELDKKLSTAIEYEYISGRKVILRDLPPSKVITYIYDKLNTSTGNSSILSDNRKINEFRAFTAYTLRVLCGLGYKEICNNIYNITISGCSKLCAKGNSLIRSESLTYMNLFEELVNRKIA